MTEHWGGVIIVGKHLGEAHLGSEQCRLFDLQACWLQKFNQLTNQNSIQEEIKCRLKAGNSCYYSVQTLLSSRLLSKNLKIKIYKTIILPVVLYGCILIPLILVKMIKSTRLEWAGHVPRI